MIHTLSLDLRVGIAAALSDGINFRAAATRFGVSIAMAVHLGQSARSGKGFMPPKIGGYVKPMLRGNAADVVRKRLAAKSDWTVQCGSYDPQTIVFNRRPIGISTVHGAVAIGIYAILTKICDKAAIKNCSVLLCVNGAYCNALLLRAIDLKTTNKQAS